MRSNGLETSRKSSVVSGFGSIATTNAIAPPDFLSSNTIGGAFFRLVVSAGDVPTTDHDARYCGSLTDAGGGQAQKQRPQVADGEAQACPQKCGVVMKTMKSEGVKSVRLLVAMDPGDFSSYVQDFIPESQAKIVERSVVLRHVVYDDGSEAWINDGKPDENLIHLVARVG